LAARGLLAFVPVGGWFVAGGMAFAGTYAIAIIAQKYIENQGNLSEESIRRIYKEAFEEGKKQFKLLKNDIAKQKDNLLNELKKFIQKK
jgi:ferritin-like protein